MFIVSVTDLGFILKVCLYQSKFGTTVPHTYETEIKVSG